jgi:glycosyltransferase involved in cell wall biosynthesis
LKLIDLSYYHYHGCSDPLAVLDRQAAAIPYVDHLPDGCHPIVVKFMDYEGRLKKGSVDYHFFSGKASPFWVPHKAHRFIRELEPDVVLLHSLLFPRQVMALRQALGKRVKLMVQHHAEYPGAWWQLALQRKADPCVNGYLFASKELARPWQERNVIRNSSRIFTAPEGSNGFTLRDKKASRKATGVEGEPAFLWVGRLDANKDPLTALQAFHHYRFLQPQARLYMLYQTKNLLQEVSSFIDDHQLQDHVVLVGEKPYAEMEAWYNSADYYLSTSHSESYGFSLVEALACGCTPIVTELPSFRNITAIGTIGTLFPAGNAVSLFEQLCKVTEMPSEASRQSIAKYFHEHLSFSAMARSIYSIGRQLTGVKTHELPC